MDWVLWEEMVKERSELIDVSNDIKMIGKRFELSLTFLCNWGLKRVLRSSHKNHITNGIAGRAVWYFSSSEIVCEAFGELVIQSILLFRFQWLVTRDDFSSFGFSFQVYVVGVMSISFVTMVSTILKYHNRNRTNLRETFSLHTLSLVMFWIILLVIKVMVYAFGFMNNPGLFWVPMILKMCFLWLIFSCKCWCNSFQSLPPHDKFVFILASSLVPVSIPSKGKKSVKNLYPVSLLLFLVECLCVLLFAYLIRHFYHFEAFKDFYEIVLPEKLSIATFESLFLYMIVALVSVILVAIFLLSISNNCCGPNCHPKATLFSENNSKEARNVVLNPFDHDGHNEENE